jgi:hypothetical protein
LTPANGKNSPVPATRDWYVSVEPTADIVQAVPMVTKTWLLRIMLLDASTRNTEL